MHTVCNCDSLLHIVYGADSVSSCILHNVTVVHVTNRDDDAAGGVKFELQGSKATDGSISSSLVTVTNVTAHGAYIDFTVRCHQLLHSMLAD
jgi:hypothetical protein